MEYKRIATLWGLMCLLTISLTQAQNLENPLGKIKMDTNTMKKMVSVSCDCFKPLNDINIPSIDFMEEPQRDTQRRDSVQQAGKVLLDKLSGCLTERMLAHKDKLGFSEVPDSLLNLSINPKEPPIILKSLSPNILLYAMRDCPYIFSFCKKAIDVQQASIQKRQAQIDSVRQARLADTLNVQQMIEKEKKPEPPVAENEYRERPNFKRIKATLKRIESKNLPYLVVEREDAEGKKYEERFLILYQPDDEDEIIKNFKQHKGKKVTLEARKQETFNPKNNQYEQLWRVTFLSFLE